MLIQIVIVSSLLAVMAAAIGTTVSGLQRESRALNEQLAHSQAHMSLSQSLISVPICSSYLQAGNFSSGMAPEVSGAISATSPIIAPLVRVGDLERGRHFSPLARFLAVHSDPDAIHLRISEPPSGLRVRGAFVVRLNQDSLVRSLPNIEVPVLVQLAGPPGSTQIQGCSVFSENLDQWARDLASESTPPPAPCRVCLVDERLITCDTRAFLAPSSGICPRYHSLVEMEHLGLISAPFEDYRGGGSGGPGEGGDPAECRRLPGRTVIQCRNGALHQ